VQTGGTGPRSIVQSSGVWHSGPPPLLLPEPLLPPLELLPLLPPEEALPP
jgi:hypothetical protein